MTPFSILLALGVLGAPGYVKPSEYPAPAVVSLPSPRTEGKVSVEAALRMRRSTRSFAVTPLTLQAVAQGLGSTYVGGFRPSELRAVHGLPSDEERLAVLPVGRMP
jgi:nitroreductase